jgi:hypothetical protein
MKTLTKINGWFRLLFGFCPKCNSDVPDLYDCTVCEWYRTSEKGMPDMATKKKWWKKFITELKNNDTSNSNEGSSKE